MTDREETQRRYRQAIDEANAQGELTLDQLRAMGGSGAYVEKRNKVTGAIDSRWLIIHRYPDPDALPHGSESVGMEGDASETPACRTEALDAQSPTEDLAERICHEMDDSKHPLDWWQAREVAGIAGEIIDERANHEVRRRYASTLLGIIGWLVDRANPKLGALAVSYAAGLGTIGDMHSQTEAIERHKLRVEDFRVDLRGEITPERVAAVMAAWSQAKAEPGAEIAIVISRPLTKADLSKEVVKARDELGLDCNAFAKTPEIQDTLARKHRSGHWRAKSQLGDN